jgi:hypothetical protein
MEVLERRFPKSRDLKLGELTNQAGKVQEM